MQHALVAFSGLIVQSVIKYWLGVGDVLGYAWYCAAFNKLSTMAISELRTGRRSLDALSEIDRKNRELYELQHQMLISPKSVRKGLKSEISVLDAEINVLQKTATKGKSSRRENTIGFP